MGVAGLWPLIKAAGIHVDPKTITINNLHYDPGGGPGTGLSSSSVQQPVVSSSTVATVPAHQDIRDLAKKIFDDTWALFPLCQSISFHLDGADGYTKEQEHARRAKTRQQARHRAKVELDTLQSKFDAGRWISKSLPDRIYRDLRKAHRLSDAQKKAFGDAIKECDKAMQTAHAGPLTASRSDGPLPTATRATYFCQCSTEADTCIAFSCHPSGPTQQAPASPANDLRDETVIVTRDSDLIMYSEVQTVFRPNPKGSFFLRYRKKDVKEALDFSEDFQLMTLAIVCKNDYTSNFPGFGIKRNRNVIRDFDPAVVQARKEREAEERRRKAALKKSTSKGKSSRKRTRDASPTEVPAGTSTMVSSSSSVISVAVTTRKREASRKRKASPVDERWRTMTPRQYLSRYCEAVTESLKDERRVLPSRYERSLLAFAFLCTSLAGKKDDKVLLKAGRNIRQYEPRTIEEGDEEQEEIGPDQLGPPVEIDEPKLFQDLYNRYVQEMGRSRALPANPVSVSTLKTYNCSYRNHGRSRWRNPYEHIFPRVDSNGNASFLAGLEVADIGNCKERPDGPRQKQGGRKGQGMVKKNMAKRRKRKTKADAGTGRVKIYQQKAEIDPAKPTKESNVTAETTKRRQMVKDFVTITITAGSLLGNSQQCLSGAEAIAVNKRIQDCVATKLRLENDLYDIYAVCIDKFRQRTTAAAVLSSLVGPSLAGPSSLVGPSLAGPSSAGPPSAGLPSTPLSALL
ncbi:hypothetical protein EMPS_08454 [Entomortierella parvispora]|uniref:Uncharacterized protein n=1 Tax=Entomortierella parvispora TaxID=205924 RepID=A0A9P3HG20_9FUNG|nr:hypothetical protein EMPS_08454 [Entomortierella parvispora]